MNGTTVVADFFLLPPRQATVLRLISTYVETYRRPCPSTVVADALGKDRTTIRQHYRALYQKGWLLDEHSPAKPKRSYLRPLDA